MYLTGRPWVESVYPEVSFFLFVKFTEVLNQFSHLDFALYRTEGAAFVNIAHFVSKLLLINLVQILWRRCL